jgi:hypothetical protein
MLLAIEQPMYAIELLPVGGQGFAVALPQVPEPPEPPLDVPATPPPAGVPPLPLPPFAGVPPEELPAIEAVPAVDVEPPAPALLGVPAVPFAPAALEAPDTETLPAVATVPAVLEVPAEPVVPPPEPAPPGVVMPAPSSVELQPKAIAMAQEGTARRERNWSFFMVARVRSVADRSPCGPEPHSIKKSSQREAAAVRHHLMTIC